MVSLVPFAAAHLAAERNNDDQKSSCEPTTGLVLLAGAMGLSNINLFLCLGFRLSGGFDNHLAAHGEVIN